MLVYHYLQYAKDCCLVNDPDCTQGTQRYSDSDFAGMWAVNGDTRSRSGSYIAHNGFPVAWRSAYQDCRATSHGGSATDEYATDAQLAISTGYAETIAMSETMKMVLHHSYITEELGFKSAYPMIIDVDAAAAKGFADGLGKASRMKHIDIRDAWVQQLRDRKKAEFRRIPGVDNAADFFTKLLNKPNFKKWAEMFMGTLPPDRGSLEISD
jgi:hypothetical protein